MKQSQLVVGSLALIALAITACSGGSNTALPHAGATPLPKASSAVKQQAVRVTLLIPKRAPAARRGRQYVSSSTQSASISVNGTAEIAFSTSSGAPGCTLTQTGNSCSAMVDAPVGPDTFTLSTYDGPLANATTSGNLLSTGSASQTIVVSTANAVNLTLAGAIASVAVSLTPNDVPAGLATSLPFVVNALDADQNVIVGPGDYVDESGNPVTIELTKTDTSGSTSLSASSITAPGTSVNVQYSGNGLHGAVPTFVATAGSLPAASATLSVTPTLQAFATLPQSSNGGITVGGDGNLYVLDAFPDPITTRQDIEVQKITTSSGAVQTFAYSYEPCPAPTTGSEGFANAGGGIATGADGDIFFAVPDECSSANSDKLVDMTPSGVFTIGTFELPDATARYTAGGSNASIAFAANGVAVLTEGTVTQGGSAPTAIPTGAAFVASNTSGGASSVTYQNALGLGSTGDTFDVVANQIATPSDDSAWFPGTLIDANGLQKPTIVRSTTSGSMTSFPIPQPTRLIEYAEGVTSASDGNVWYVGDRFSQSSDVAINELSIGKVTTAGTYTDIPIVNANGDEVLYNAAIVDGSDANLYTLATDETTNQVILVQVTHAGLVTLIGPQVVGGTALPNYASQGFGVRANDGNIYFNVDATSLIKLVY